VRPRLRRKAAIGLPPSARFAGPPTYVVEAARAGDVEIGQARWALVAPGDYASQKVLLLLFDPSSGDPWTIVKLGADPAHAERLRNEAASLTRLGELGLPDGTFPTLRFAGEHAGRGIVGQSWLAGKPFTSATTPEATSSYLAAAASWLTSLATRSVQRRSAADVGAAVADLLDRFRVIHTLPDDEMAFLEQQVQAIGAHAGELPVVFQHGDPGAWNLLAGDEGRVAFLDWESAEVHGMPLWDLFHFQASFGAWASRTAGVRRRLEASMRHLATASDLQAAFASQIRELGDAVDLPRSMIRPLFYAAWMHRSLKEATRRTPATLERGLYLRLLRELIRRRDEPALRRMLDGDA
jgi:thiamine kinase-like enzyme